MPMHNPPHPSEIIREDYVKRLDLTITESAEGLGINRKNLSRILNGHAGVSPDMAVRLANALDSTPEMWLKLQMAYDLAQARKKDENNRVKKFAPARR
ncbi:MAG: HigA family addiction module antidote protein [Bacteroidetes bacterium]|nr:HigA family addiction module antidote protein [Bacteroidota bacterium]